MGLFTYTITGGGFMLIGAWELFVSSSECIQNTPLSPPLTSHRAISAINNSSTQTKKAPLSSSSVTCLSISVLFFLFILNSLISISDALNSKDHVSFAFQLEVIAIALLFSSTQLWVSERIKDPRGVENRYYDLFLVPIGICLFCTILELKSPKSNNARLGRGVGLVLQGMWIGKMGFSFLINPKKKRKKKPNTDVYICTS
ncbi:unnamed protein product [Coffea canephora]|uniref:Uncharacterized protein n=1 Tax=Coffea canephora TaxID=49390 RepID=A0A068UAQ2_COFCA|nr:unnamed protein product [Coffea canephora]